MRGQQRLKKICRWWPVLLLVFGSGGCAMLPASTGLHRQAVLSAPPAVKRDIYREVAATIEDHRRQGDASLGKGDYYRALASYRQAAFYEQPPGLLQKIAELETKIAEESKRLFAAGQALLPKDEEAALKAFNRTLHLNPEHREARRSRDRLLAQPRFQAELIARQTALRRAWKNYAGQPGEIPTLTALTTALLDYDFDHALAREVAERLDHHRQKDIRLHLEKGLELYQAGELEQAKFFAQKARAVAPDNPEVLSFLMEIRKDQDIAYYLNLARYRLEQGDLDKAEEYAGKVLALDSDRPAAEAVLQETRLLRLKDAIARTGQAFARGEYEVAMGHLQRVLANGPRCLHWPELQESVREILNREIPAMIDQAQKLFTENKLRQANHILACVLDLDPENSMAATYLKKIQSRLDTIESLQ